MERFYDPQRGDVTLDGHPIRDLDPRWLRCAHAHPARRESTQRRGDWLHQPGARAVRRQVCRAAIDVPVTLAAFTKTSTTAGPRPPPRKCLTPPAAPTPTDLFASFPRVSSAGGGGADDRVCRIPNHHRRARGDAQRRPEAACLDGRSGDPAAMTVHRQIAIARALLKNPKILILDEATRHAHGQVSPAHAAQRARRRERAPGAGGPRRHRQGQRPQAHVPRHRAPAQHDQACRWGDAASAPTDRSQT